MTPVAESDKPFTPAASGSWFTGGQAILETVNEESAHAVLAVVLDLKVHSVRIDRPEPKVEGWAIIAPDADQLGRHLLATMAGPLFVKRWQMVPWPPDPNNTGDEGVVARLVDILELRHADVLVAEFRVRKLLENSYVKRAIREVGSALLERGALSGDDVLKIVAAA